jgi:hypothetical protein
VVALTQILHVELRARSGLSGARPAAGAGTKAPGQSAIMANMMQDYHTSRPVRRQLLAHHCFFARLIIVFANMLQKLSSRR